MNNLHDLIAKLKSLEENTGESEVEIKHHDDVEDQVDEGGWDIDDPNVASKQQALNQRVQDAEVDEDGNWVPRKSMAQTSAEWTAAQAAKKQQQPQPAPDTQGGAGAADESMEECGDMPAPKGGVQLSMDDLVKLVRALQGGGEPSDGADTLLGDEYANEPGEEVAPISAVTATGDDLASKGDEALKTNGGGNPMQAHLAELYADVKARQLDELSKDTLASYAKKASAGASTSAFKAGMSKDDKDFTKHNKKASKREDGLNKAIDKLSLKEANQIRRKILGK